MLNTRANILWFFILTKTAVSGVQAVPSVKDLAQQADEIVVATVLTNTSVVNGQTPPVSLVSAELQVVRSVAGTASATRQFTIKWSQAGTVRNDSMRGDSGVWFLKRSGVEAPLNVLSFVTQPRDLDDVRIPVSSLQLDPTYQYGRAAAVEDRVMRELLNAAESDQTGLFSYVYFGAYDDFRPAMMDIFYRRLASNSSPEKQAKGLAGLIRLGRTDALLTFERTLAALTQHTGLVAFSIAAYFRGGDAQSIAVLGRLATIPSVSLTIRKAAGQALAFIHNDKCLPFLVELLASGDPELETLGAGGLAMFANGVRVIERGAAAHFSPSGAPGPYRSEDTIKNFTLDVDKFKSDRAAYISFWRTWWNANRAAISKSQ